MKRKTEQNDFWNIYTQHTNTHRTEQCEKHYKWNYTRVS